MKKVVVCYKWLLDDADIRVSGNGQLDTSKAKYKINEYDRNAIQAGVDMKAAAGCELVGVTCGVSTKDSTKDALARGLDSVTFLNAAALADADSRATAKVLAKMAGDADVILCSEGSSDEYAQQTSSRIAALLGYTSVSFVQHIEVAGDTLKLTRKLEEGVEHVEVAGPVVISVVPDINDAPIPSVKQILGAKKKPANETDLAALGLSDADVASQLTTVSVLAPKVNRKQVRLNAGDVSVADAAAALVKALKADGVL